MVCGLPTTAGESLARFLPELGELRLRYLLAGLATAARRVGRSTGGARSRDLLLRHPRAAPGCWSIGFERAPARKCFTRTGKARGVGRAAQALGFSRDRGQWPVLLLDDLASELDAHHLSQTLDYLIQVPAQVFITGTSPIPLPADALRPSAMFHVEHAAIAPLL